MVADCDKCLPGWPSQCVVEVLSTLDGGGVQVKEQRPAGMADHVEHSTLHRTGGKMSVRGQVNAKFTHSKQSRY